MGMKSLLSAMRKSGRVLAAAAVLTMTVAGPHPTAWAQSRPMSESVAAIVNDEIISTYDLGQRVRLLILTTGIQPTQETMPQIQNEALRSLVEERLQIQELRRVEKENKANIIATDEEVDAQIKEIVEGEYRMSVDQFYALLAQNGIGRATYREQVRAEMSWQQYMHGRYGQRLRIGADQVKAYKKRMADAASKPQYQVSEIYIDAARVGGMQVAYNGAQQLLAQLQQGAPFAAVARQFSASPTAASGGEVGWVTTGEMPPQVDAVLDQLRPGQFSPPIATDEGVYIIFLKEKRAGGAATLVTLKQAAIPLPSDASDEQVAAAGQTLEQVRALAPNCTDLEAKAGQASGVIAGDMGEIELSGLGPGFAEAAASTPENQLSAPIRTQAGLHLIMVCGRRQGGAQELTDRQVENRLYGQQLSLISRRVMRDLRNSATIEQR